MLWSDSQRERSIHTRRGCTVDHHVRKLNWYLYLGVHVRVHGSGHDDSRYAHVTFEVLRLTRYWVTTGIILNIEARTGRQFHVILPIWWSTSRKLTQSLLLFFLIILDTRDNGHLLLIYSCCLFINKTYFHRCCYLTYDIVTLKWSVHLIKLLGLCLLGFTSLQLCTVLWGIP